MMILRGVTLFPYYETRLLDALQELKDDLLDDTAGPVFMQWFNEDH